MSATLVERCAQKGAKLEVADGAKRNHAGANLARRSHARASDARIGNALRKFPPTPEAGIRARPYRVQNISARRPVFTNVSAPLTHSLTHRYKQNARNFRSTVVSNRLILIGWGLWG